MSDPAHRRGEGIRVPGWGHPRDQRGPGRAHAPRRGLVCARPLPLLAAAGTRPAHPHGRGLAQRAGPAVRAPARACSVGGQRRAGASDGPTGGRSVGYRRELWSRLFGEPRGAVGWVGARVMGSAMKQYTRAMAAELPLRPDDELLDIGCGSGRLLAEHARTSATWPASTSRRPGRRCARAFVRAHRCRHGRDRPR